MTHRFLSWTTVLVMAPVSEMGNPGAWQDLKIRGVWEVREDPEAAWVGKCGPENCISSHVDLFLTSHAEESFREQEQV